MVFAEISAQDSASSGKVQLGLNWAQPRPGTLTAKGSFPFSPGRRNQQGSPGYAGAREVAQEKKGLSAFPLSQEHSGPSLSRPWKRKNF